MKATNAKSKYKKNVIRFWIVLIIGALFGIFILYSAMTDSPPHDFRGVITYFIFFIIIILLLLADVLMKDEGKHYNPYEEEEPIDELYKPRFAPADE